MFNVLMLKNSYNDKTILLNHCTLINIESKKKLVYNTILKQNKVVTLKNYILF